MLFREIVSEENRLLGYDTVKIVTYIYINLHREIPQNTRVFSKTGVGTSITY
jgi:hypothetical protein